MGLFCSLLSGFYTTRHDFFAHRNPSKRRFSRLESAELKINEAKEVAAKPVKQNQRFTDEVLWLSPMKATTGD
ncbi:Putative periplasmic protein [Helicobacter mustelae 12198]|uniref:Putative periplasmic protein n=1 Tax=Helicobacter mustelae (strain ATCC 43772 / CCUG 25715 / CIP 103759 / LMG 18044 / NCTC 12198 / R85-136P) TaxID=679897 RepID=D3UFR1_HELM1|nr:Putative periplasmic protein [Helicobacter mustelae 12198]